MNFLTAVHTDVGIKKKTNQDSALIVEAETPRGRAMLAVIADGMGGLAKGELASATVIRAFDTWFENDLPEVIGDELDPDIVRKSWEDVIFGANEQIGGFGKKNGFSLGSTVVAVLIVEGNYYITYVGDSRAYVIDESRPIQLTRDQTFVQREVEMGRMTQEDAANSPKRNMLLQCVGASDIIDPEFVAGKVIPGQVFMLCSDGFRHVVSEQEIFERLNPSMTVSEQVINDNIKYLTELNKYRRETDNITAVVVRVL